MNERPITPAELDALRCFIDLHLHLDGSLSIASVRKLAELQGIPVPVSDAELKQRLSVSADCRDLNEYLEKFEFPCSLLMTWESLREAVRTLLGELAAEGHIYTELRFAPQKHCEKGLTQEEAVLAALEGLKDSPIPANLILCCMRGNDNRAENLETVKVAAKYLGQGVCAVDLAGAEALFPTADFEDVFRLAREKGVPMTIHAGEADGPESVRMALSFGAARLGHGVRSAEDGELLRILSEKGTTLELCPTSNLNTVVVSDLRDYPLRQLLDAGVKLTVNTDNRSVSDTTIRREFQLLAETFRLTRAEIRQLLLNAAEAAFAPESVKAALREKIEAAF